MSSSSHQTYLVRWAKDIEVPIFSIDYRLAPYVSYPQLLDDVIRGYLWILVNLNFTKGFLKFVLKVEPISIIFAGDSAGGSLAAALTSWTIENGVRRPDGILLAYPGKFFFISSFYAK